MNNEQVDYIFNRAEKLLRLYFELKKPVKAKQEKKRINEFGFYAGGKEFCYNKDQWRSWVGAYNKDFVNSELTKAIAWLECNAQKAPKTFPRFFNNWLSRAWEDHRKNLPSNGASNALLTESELSQE